MTRLIDADNLLSGIYSDNPDDVMKYIASCDVVDAVQVIRCRDCKHMTLTKPPLGGICDLTEAWEREDFYCADGEAKT